MPIDVLIAIGGFLFSIVSHAVSITWVVARINARGAENRTRCDRIERDLEKEEQRALASLEKEIVRAMASEKAFADALATHVERITMLATQVHEIRNKITPRILEADIQTAAAIAELRDRMTRSEARMDSMLSALGKIEARTDRKRE